MTEDILAAMQFSFFVDKNPINTSTNARLTITYQYATTAEPVDWFSGSTFTGWTPFTAAEKAALEAALAHIETFLNVDFVEVTNNADPDLNLGNVTLPGSTVGFGGPSISFFGSTISRWDGFAVYDNTLDLSLPSQTGLLLHELGHAMGLKHPFNAPTLPAATESNKFTVMSYTENPDTGDDAEVMMIYDVLALQDIWGAADFNTGNTIYTGPRGGVLVDTVWDTGGTDLFNASGRTNDTILDLRAGQFSRFGSFDDLAIAYGVKIENATGGSGDDMLIGNGLRNAMNGGSGNDTVKAGGGSDTVRGGGGNDTLRGQNGNDTLFGDAGKDRLFGDSGIDTIRGGGGRDRIDGGDGNDRMFGGGGRDTFTFKAGSGADIVVDFQNDLDILRFSGLGSLATVQAAAAEVGADVVFTFAGGDILTVRNTTLAEVSDDIFA